jgi:ABC-type antimicrobial peptide transport system permease subunit
MHVFWTTSVAVRAAASVLALNRWRSLLTLAICGMGTAGVIIAGVLAEIHLTEMSSRVEALGGNLLIISPNKLPPFPGRPRQLEHFISLLPEDAVALKGLSPASAVVPVVARQSTIRMNGKTARVRLVGTTFDYLDVRGFTLEDGRFLGRSDDGDRVIVLGNAVARELAPQGMRLGEILFLGGAPYTVIGILRPQGVNFAGEDEDHQVFIPLETYRRRIANRLWLSHLYVQLPSDTNPQRTVGAIQGLLRQRHERWDYQVDDVLVRNLADLAAGQSDLLTTVVWVVSVTGVLLLLLGVSGISTLMLLLVRQRRAEIGLRRALGATPLDIAFQFFCEGIVLAATGIVAGLVFGMIGSFVVAQTLSAPIQWMSQLPALAIILSLTASTIACVFPAFIAARLEPSAALQP